jgi:hypothetical protein
MDITRLNSVPPELRRGIRFTCWRAEQNREGVWVKIPVDVHTGKDATFDNPGTWSTWDEATAYYLAHQNTVMGLARVIDTSDVPRMMAVTFAGCLDRQQHLLHDHPAAQWVDRFDSYTELSSSGDGVTVWIYATHDLGGQTSRSKNLGDDRAIVLYRSPQWLPLTGQRLVRYSGIVEHRQPVVNALCQALFGAENARHSKPVPPLWRRPSFTTDPPPARNPTPISANTPARASTSPLKIDIAKDFLQAALRNGAMEQARIIAAAKDRGITVITLRRAKRGLRVRSTRRTFQGTVLWASPQRDQ